MKNTSRESFKQRTAYFWGKFEEKESNIRQLMLDKADGNLLVGAMNEILSEAFDDIPFEMGINEEKIHELILSPNGNRILLMQILYLLRHKPTHLDKFWNFYATKPAQGKDGINLSIYNTEITADDFLIYPDIDSERQIINIEVFVPILDELKESDKYNALFIMLDLFIGELYTMEHVGGVEIIETEKDGQIESISLTKLKSYIDYIINEHEWKKAINITENYSGYKANGDKDTTDLRKDVYIGFTSSFDIIRDIEEEEIYPLKHLAKDGVFMGYLFYDNSTVPEQEMVDQRADIEDKIINQTKEAGIADSTGGATGYKNSYIDFIIYDFKTFIEIAEEVMNNYDFSIKGFAFFEQPENPIIF